jgi:phosphoglycerol transferase MdoB-like AlkP superfamily enzyme
MFATMACFPNLPGFEYLMQTPEGSHKLSGLPQLLSARKYDDVYVYNGDFAWDNQSGFFSNQGMTNFIGRNDFVNPVFSDPTWGVSDQDMFDRGLEELKARERQAVLCAAANPVQPHAVRLANAIAGGAVTDRGTPERALDRHALFRLGAGPVLREGAQRAVLQGNPVRHRRRPRFRQRAADHRNGPGPLQRADADDCPGIQEKFGQRDHTVGTQIDIVPTIMGRLGGEVRHQCWGRDLLNLPEGDKGFGVIKPSGSEQTVPRHR